MEWPGTPSVRETSTMPIYRPTCIAIMLITALASLAGRAADAVPTAPDPFLKTSGADIRDARGRGDIVPLRGVNLGGWLVMEGWMCPMDGSGLKDDYSVRETLIRRF